MNSYLLFMIGLIESTMTKLSFGIGNRCGNLVIFMRMIIRCLPERLHYIDENGLLYWACKIDEYELSQNDEVESYNNIWNWHYL